WWSSSPWPWPPRWRRRSDPRARRPRSGRRWPSGSASKPVPLPPEDVLRAARGRISHVVVLMLENRSFDHLLGYLDHPASDYPGLRGKSYPNPVILNDPNADVADVSADADYVLLADPPHGHEEIKKAMDGHRWRDFRMDGFAAAYGDKLAGR